MKNNSLPAIRVTRTPIVSGAEATPITIPLANVAYIERGAYGRAVIHLARYPKAGKRGTIGYAQSQEPIECIEQYDAIFAATNAEVAEKGAGVVK